MPANRSRKSCRMARILANDASRPGPLLPSPPHHPRRSTDMAGTGARYFFLFLVGLVMGAILTVMGLRTWQARQDPFPDALMHVQQWHAVQLKNNLEANR